MEIKIPNRCLACNSADIEILENTRLYKCIRCNQCHSESRLVVPEEMLKLEKEGIVDLGPNNEYLK
jgi:Zn finger protein HypA/HybF involved in hydrogenase expression